MPPRKHTAAPPRLAPKTLVIDNGAYTIKAGFVPASTPKPDSCHVIPNCLARSRDRKTYIGSELENCKDFGEMAFRRPVEKGYLVNWEAEKAIWEHSFFSKSSAIQVIEN
jgi:actin-related protein 6